MSSLRSACIVVSATPLMLVACVDLGNLASKPDDGGAPDAEAIGVRCPPGEKACAGGCVPTNLPAYGCASDACDRCSIPFADTLICEDGKCSVGLCPAGRGSCDGDKANGCEADLTTAATCGACTSACPVGSPLCNAGQCVKDCLGGTTQCGTQCVDLKTNATNCGVCGNVCPPAKNGTGSCVDGSCTVKCNTGFGDCDANLGNGCEDLKPFYADNDGDGFGGGAKTGEACTAPPGSSLIPGDCNDTNNNVKPGQSAFFFTGYTNAAGMLSYDYDCNGTEEVEPTKPVGDCSTCRVNDFVKVVRSPAPPGASLYCGSVTRITSCLNGSASVCSTSSASSTMGCR